VRARRVNLERRKARLLDLYEHLVIDRQEFDIRYNAVLTELSTLPVNDTIPLEDVAQQVASLADTWRRATAAQQQLIARHLFVAVYVDAETKSVVAIEPTEILWYLVDAGLAPAGDDSVLHEFLQEPLQTIRCIGLFIQPGAPAQLVIELVA